MKEPTSKLVMTLICHEIETVGFFLHGLITSLLLVMVLRETLPGVAAETVYVWDTDRVIRMTKRDAGRGCLLGALVGDAAGATLEFLGRTPERSEVKQALMMVGGGHWRTAPGQITDDGELALCLARALAGSSSFPIEKVACEYLKWYQSLPFDIGNTTATGLEGGLRAATGTVHVGMWRAAEQQSMGSKANGALMRVAPLGIWGLRIREEDLVSSVSAECRLTHPNPTCQYTSALYCLAIRHLVLNPGDGVGAFARAKEWAEHLGNTEIVEWLGLAEQGVDVGYHPHSGFVRYGFVHAFRHLRLGTPYMSALAETLLGGGDTDTNACIVGGLSGALHGEPGIPEVLRIAVMNCDTEKGRPRPEWLQTRAQLPGLLEALLACSALRISW
jgi:ADP-ribosyl-[dinitrogen reductase] hydrolase